MEEYEDVELRKTARSIVKSTLQKIGNYGGQSS